ncbi:MAG: excisionase family DNA-binding protein [Pirellulaceae bacterium]
MLIDAETFLTCQQASKLIGVSRSTIQRYCDEGLLKQHRTAGGHRRIKATDIDEFLRESGLTADASYQSASRQKIDTYAFLELLRESKIVEAEAQLQRYRGSQKDLATLFDNVIEPVLWEIHQQVEHKRIASTVFSNIQIQLRYLISRINANTHQLVADPISAVGFSFAPTTFELESELLASALKLTKIHSTNLGSLDPSQSPPTILNNIETAFVWVCYGEHAGDEKLIESNLKLFDSLPEGTRLIIFGTGLTRQTRRSMKFDFFGETYSQIVQFCRRYKLSS